MKRMPTVITMILATALMLAACGEAARAITPEEVDKLPPRERCGILPDEGTCKAFLPKYYYDAKEKKCAVAYGCGGIVPFGSMEECEKACMP